MFRCQLCRKTTQPHTPAYKLTIETRQVCYAARTRANACYKRKWIDGELRSKFTHTDDPGGWGKEPARELTVCPDCLAAHTARQVQATTDRNKQRRAA